jgi:hypothetical protein
MPQNFVACDRDQELLLPPSLRDWLSEDHLALFVVDAVAEMELSGFYGSYRTDGDGRPAFDPEMMVALVLNAYCRGQRSSRGIERACVEDVAFRVIAANQSPDHATVARFRCAMRMLWRTCSDRCWGCALARGWCRLVWSRSTGRSWVRCGLIPVTRTRH